MLATRPVDLAKPDDRHPREICSLLLLGSLACLLLVGAFFSGFVMPQAPGRMAEPSTLLIPSFPLWSLALELPLPVPRQPVLLACGVLALSTLKFAIYSLGVYVAWKQPAGRPQLVIVVGAAVLLFLTSVFALPNVNRDIFNYILSGRVAAVHGANPYAAAPDLFPADPVYQYASQRYTSFAGDNKLPAWMLINIVLAWLGGDNVVTNLLLYRSVFFLFNLANIALIVSILRAVHPQRLLAGLVVYAWNPIVIALGQSKVDTVMVFFLLLAVLALVRGRGKLAFVALGVSVLVKLITLPLLAILWLRQLRARGLRTAAANALLVGLTAAAIYLPFWYGPDMLNMQLGLLGNASSTAPDLLRRLVWASFVMVVLLIGLRRDRQIQGLLFDWTVVMVLFALFLTKLSFSWYLITLVALASLSVDRRLVPITIALTFISFLMNSWDTASNEVFQLPKLSALPRYFVFTLFVCAAALGLAAVEIYRRTRQRYSAQS